MDNKIIGRFEPIGDDKGPKRSAFNVLTKEPAEELGTGGLPGYTGFNASGLRYSVIGKHWQWVPALPVFAEGPAERQAAVNAMLAEFPGLAAQNAIKIINAGYRKFEIVDEPAFGHLALSTGGLTMRDYFACSILPGVFSNETALERFRTASAAEGFPIASLITSAAYGIADAMLTERAK